MLRREHKNKAKTNRNAFQCIFMMFRYPVPDVRQKQIKFQKKCDVHRQWRIQDFPEEGALIPKGGGAPTYYLANFSRKLHENEESLGQRGGARPSRPP